mmetsp:Transcript_20935/g.59161  ORF Transcript_20935/g.59161 Transcript_20935/m.59161 type:complete len:153 (+) Transcript_20935:582-1040(+)
MPHILQWIPGMALSMSGSMCSVWFTGQTKIRVLCSTQGVSRVLAMQADPAVMLCWQSAVGSSGLGPEHGTPVVVSVTVEDVDVVAVLELEVLVVVLVVEVSVMVSPSRVVRVVEVRVEVLVSVSVVRVWVLVVTVDVGVAEVVVEVSVVVKG